LLSNPPYPPRRSSDLHRANVKVVSIGGGFAYGGLGISHHATEDIAVMRALPWITVLAPGDTTEVEAATRTVYETPGTCYLRLGRSEEHTSELQSRGHI